MSLRKPVALLASALAASMCSGCAVPRFDVPNDDAGQPTVQSIVRRIECELRDMVRDDMGDKDVTSFHRRFLLNGDYDVEVALSFEVNDTGGLAPNILYINPSTKLTTFMLGGTATLSEGKDHNFSENLQISVRKIYTDWKTRTNLHDCPSADTNLAGTLGIKNYRTRPG